MESVSSRQRPKLDRRNALKHIDYEASRSAPQSPSHSRFIDEDHVLASHSHSRFIDEDRVLGGSLTSFRVHGVDGKQEIERICKILGLSGPEAFAIPTAAWEARKAKSLSKPNPPEEEQSQKIEGKSDGFRSTAPSERSAPSEVNRNGTVSSASPSKASLTTTMESLGISAENANRAYGRSMSEGEREVAVSMPERVNFGKIKPSIDAVPRSPSGIRGVRSSILAPPPCMSLRVSTKAVSTWDILKSLAPEEDVSPSSSEGVLCVQDNKDDRNSDSSTDSSNADEDEEENETELERTRSSPLSTSNGDESSSGSTDETVYIVSPDARFKVPFQSWIKGDKLGSGSFGTVYEGISDDGVFFAVKEVSLLDQGSNARQCIYQLEQEIALLSQFEHENIVRYLGTDKEQDRLYIFLELVTQGSLASLYQKYNLRDSQVRAYTRQILNGLKYLHDRNVMHRDIKCANILVDAYGLIKLADFGLAKETSKLNELKSCKGSAYWMAPEVIHPRKTYWLPADIWSLGCTVLEMLTRSPPYGGLEWHRALWKVGHGEPPPLPDTLSRDAEDFIQKCLVVEPVDRPSAGELLDHPFVKRSFSAEFATAQPPRESRFQNS
eukprot:Gb_03243 [translate_table: standard]